MYFANLYIAFLHILPYDMEASENMFGGGVGPWFLHVGNHPYVVAEDNPRVSRIGEHYKFDDKLPEPNSFICSIRCSNIL